MILFGSKNKTLLRYPLVGPAWFCLINRILWLMSFLIQDKEMTKKGTFVLFFAKRLCMRKKFTSFVENFCLIFLLSREINLKTLFQWIEMYLLFILTKLKAK